MVPCHILSSDICNTVGRGDFAVAQKGNQQKHNSKETEDELRENRQKIVVIERLQQLRKRRNKTQAYMSDALLMSQGDYSKAERGLRSFSPYQIQQMAIVLKTSMDYLCGISDDDKCYGRPDDL